MMGTVKAAKTLDGIVIREIFAGGERSYRLSPEGHWHYCADHKGPWVGVHVNDVPLWVQLKAGLDLHADSH